MRFNLLIRFLIAFIFYIATCTRCVFAFPGTESTSVKSSLRTPVFFDSIAVHKGARELLVFSHDHFIKKYKIHLGLNPMGRKQVQGDYKTPEGLYHISAKNPYCSFHKGLSISYPNADDIIRAKKLGKSPGGDIMIHGLPNGQEHVGPHRYQNDWTWGCIALSNADIDELFDHVKTGIPVLITP